MWRGEILFEWLSAHASVVCTEMKMIHEKEIEFAKNRDASPPDWSNTVELLLRKGVKAYRKKKDKANNHIPV